MRSLLSPAWYRFAALTPRLRPHAEIHRQVFRGQVWYVLQDHLTGRFHRISPAVNLMLCLMDGRRTLDDIWTAVAEKAGDEPPTQDETIRLLAQLHLSDLLQSELPPDFEELADRGDKQQRRELLLRLRNPLSLRLPLLDPDHILDLTIAFVRPLFTWVGMVAWLILVAVGLGLVVLHWPELTSDLADRVLAGQNVVIALLVYPVIKTAHELGHAYATKRWGGEVHEVGLMLLIFIPVAYVDASSSTAFIEKRRRMIVGAAGILVELALAAVAMIVWVNASPGVVRIVCFNVMLIGGISTIVFNGNPLLRFDGYYILADFLEIPNLGSRANRFFVYLVERHLLGTEAEDPSTARSERPWLVFYAVASFLYRLLVTFGIAVFLATKFFFFGAILAISACISAFVLPLAKGVRFLIYDRRMTGHRRRGFAVFGGAAALLICVFFLVPLPYASVAEGVVWIPERAEVRAQTAGVVNYVAPFGATVQAGELLVGTGDPIIASQVAVKEAQLSELQNRRVAVSVSDRVQTEIIDEQIRHLQSSLRLLRARAADLDIRSAQDGRFYPVMDAGFTGRFVKKGELVGYVLSDSETTIRAIVSQSDLDLVRERLKSVGVRLADASGRTLPARLSRELPGGGLDIPSLAFTSQGGGSIAVDPSAKGGKPRAFNNIFQVDVVLDHPVADFAGQHAWVRFGFGREPIGWRLARDIRLTFLRHFRV